uniref:Selenoprotein O n=1 Tax=Albugo laibachii Nc14 TaxID=890382 RepID=F0WYC9_9STRA|nr:selenoprotein O putative [Albugo laibachii Nc14]|eukprot:CCA26481.1 selenoprotein O putative [Albugo laibachii Nc14]
MSREHSSRSDSIMYRGYWKRTAAPVFDNVVLRELAIDCESKAGVRQFEGASFSKVKPSPIKNPELVICSPETLKLVGIQVSENKGDGKDERAPIEALTPYLAGNKLFPGSETAAQCYCGHQFGYFSGQLGDGAAIYLGESIAQGSDNRWEMQLKGAGLTPFSRQADGRKVLRSTLREFLASEHMHALGIPTTRAGSVVVSHESKVVRDMFYTGDAQEEPCAVVLRVAKTFIRFGTFEIFKERDPHTGRSGPSAYLPHKKEMMMNMLNFTIKQYFPEVYQKYPSDMEKYVVFYRSVVEKTAKLVAKWQSVGFIHGVLNTDNMSIIGDTLDYGPFGFMEYFDPKHISNTSDDSGRYRFEAQPDICKFNCSVLADQLALAVDSDRLATILEEYDAIYEREYYSLMLRKLGIVSKSDSTGSREKALIDGLIDVLAGTGADYTCTMRALAQVDPFGEEGVEGLVELIASYCSTFEQAISKYSKISNEQIALMRNILMTRPQQARMYGLTNDSVVLLEQQKAKRDELTSLGAARYLENNRILWKTWLEEYRARAREDTNGVPDVSTALLRKSKMLELNPAFVLRNHVAQAAIDFASKREYGQVAHIFHLLLNPFNEPSPCDLQYARPQDPSTPTICVSCSS